MLEKKEGLFRKNMMGKRVNYAARSVFVMCCCGKKTYRCAPLVRLTSCREVHILREVRILLQKPFTTYAKEQRDARTPFV